jgi:hypothetical protein
MKLRTNSIAVVALVSGLLLSISQGGGDWASIVPTVHADHRHASESCSNATVNGAYGFYRAGTTSAGPLAALGILVNDSNGNGTFTQSISRNGVFTFDVTSPYTLEVADDCTGKGFLSDGTEFVRMVIVDGGEGLYLLSVTSGNAVYGVARRIHRPEHDDDR